MNKIFLFLIILFLTTTPVTKVVSHEEHHGDLVEATTPFPEINFKFKKVTRNEIKIVFKLKNFKLIPLKSEDAVEMHSMEMTNSGHLIVEINNKEFMVDQNEFLFDRSILVDGRNEVFVMLMDHKHNLYSINGEVIYKAKLLEN